MIMMMDSELKAGERRGKSSNSNDRKKSTKKKKKENINFKDYAGTIFRIIHMDMKLTKRTRVSFDEGRG